MSKIYDALRKAEREKRGERKSAPIKSKRSSDPRPDVKLSDRGRDNRLLDGLNETFRRSLMTLRNAVESETKDRESSIIVFTSAVKGEGKTTIISAFARVLAVGGSKKICVVDAAVRNPGLHRMFGTHNKKGIIDYLDGQAELEAIVQDIDGIHFIPAGVTPDIDIAMPLFNSRRMAQFVRQISDTYDYALFDTSAILQAPETPIITSYSDGVILVVRTGKTRREVIKRAMLMVEKLDGRFIGTILNRKKFYIPEFIYRRV